MELPLNPAPVNQTLPASRIDCREHQNQLSIRIAARPVRFLTRFGGLAVFWISVILLIAYLSGGWLPAIVVFAIVGAFILSIALLGMSNAYLTTTSVSLTTRRAVVKASRFGRQSTRDYSLNPGSSAWQWYSRQRTRRGSPQPQGIEIGVGPYDAERGSELDDETKPRFGGGLSRGELDWLEWRVNEFLRNASADVAPKTSSDGDDLTIDSVAKRHSPPEGNQVRIEDDAFATRFQFPNTRETGTYAGASTIIFSLLPLAFATAVLLQWWNARPGVAPVALFVLGLLIGLFFLLLGFVAILSGLTRMFGQRTLTITPETVCYRASLLGIGTSMRVPLAEVTSVWQPAQDTKRGKPRRAVAAAQQAVIRTASRQLPLRAVVDAVRDGNDARWLAGEISRTIEAARAKS